MYSMPGWGNVTRLPIDVSTDLLNPYVNPDGTLWFTSTPSSFEYLTLYSCDPDQNDGYCGGSADSEDDCCDPINPCVGVGCGTHPACLPCTPTVTECAPTQTCGTIDDGCGNPVDCGPVGPEDCAPVADECSTDSTGIISTAVSCVNNTCVETPTETPCTPVADECSLDSTKVIVTEVSCVNNTCVETPTETPCEYGCDDGACKTDLCTFAHPAVENAVNCEVECLDDGILRITTLDENNCSFDLDVRKDGTAFANIILRNGYMECSVDGCALGGGFIEVKDNGQKITAVPSGEHGIITGIVGTHYNAEKHEEAGSTVFEVGISEGCVWYQFPGHEKIYLARVVEACEGETDVTYDKLTSTKTGDNYVIETEGKHTSENPDDDTTTTDTDESTDENSDDDTITNPDDDATTSPDEDTAEIDDSTIEVDDNESGTDDESDDEVKNDTDSNAQSDDEADEDDQKKGKSGGGCSLSQ